MGLKRWTGSGYADVNLAKYGASTVPKNAYVWDGSAYKRVWPIGPQADAKLWMKFDNQADFLQNLGTATTPVDIIGDVTHAWDHVRYGSGRLHFTPSTNWYSGFTFSYWTRDTAANSGWETIMHRAVPSGTLTNEAYIVHNTSSTTTTVVSGLKFGATHKETYSNYSLPVGTDWFHTVVVWTRTSTTGFNVTFYINGVQRGSTNHTGYSSSASQFGSEEVWVGGNRTANEWSGRMDDLTLWDRPLSAAEVTEVYNQGRSFVPQITTTSVPTFIIGDAYSLYFTTDFSPTSWSATGLPPGISINPSTGQLTGTPTTETTGTMTVTASGSGGLTAQKSFAWTSTDWVPYSTGATVSQFKPAGSNAWTAHGTFTVPYDMVMDLHTIIQWRAILASQRVAIRVNGWWVAYSPDGSQSVQEEGRRLFLPSNSNVVFETTNNTNDTYRWIDGGSWSADEVLERPQMSGPIARYELTRNADSRVMTWVADQSANITASITGFSWTQASSSSTRNIYIEKNGVRMVTSGDEATSVSATFSVVRGDEIAFGAMSASGTTSYRVITDGTWNIVEN